jgi:hypothetical protein
MAEEINISTPTGNGPERMEVKIGPGSLGLSTKNILPVVALLGAFGLTFAGGYFIATNLTSGQERGQGTLALITQLINTQFQGMAEVLTRNHEAELKVLMDNHQVEMDLLTAHTRELEQVVRDNAKLMSGKLSVHDYNTGRALENRLPLDVDPAQLPPREETPR